MTLNDSNMEQLTREVAEVSSSEALDALEQRELGRSGRLTLELKALKDISDPAARRQSGQELNGKKHQFLAAVNGRRQELGTQAEAALAQTEALDVTAPGAPIKVVHSHPVTSITRELVAICRDLGFMAVDGPEVESEFYNFTALNIQARHPARDMWSTFWLEHYQDLLLRTHTSPMQARHLQKNRPPLRIVVPGRTYRYEATDRTHEAQFSQLEGLMVDKRVTVAEFKAVIETMLARLFKTDQMAVRLRPSYFPFVEPGFEVDMGCVFCKQKGCEVCKRSGWIEMMGAGLVRPQVFRAVGYDPEDWQGFAFGLGIERAAMLKYNIRDMRVFLSGNVRLTQQF